MKTDNNKAWFLMLPAMGILAVVGVVPLLAVFNYAFFDIFTLEKRFWIGTEWFAELVRSPDVYASLARSLFFSCLVIAVQFPLGIGIALIIPRSRSISAAILILVSIPLLIPWNLIPMFWLNLLHPDFGLLSALFDATGIPFDYKFNTAHTYILLVLMVYGTVNYKISQGSTTVYQTFLIATLIKMVLAVIFLLPLMYGKTVHSKIEAINFFLPYFFFLGFEMYNLNKFLKETRS
ncbi:MAG: carbohydrate ABC transporter permease [Marinirhabdus sp.]